MLNLTFVTAWAWGCIIWHCANLVCCYFMISCIEGCHYFDRSDFSALFEEYIDVLTSYMGGSAFGY